MHKVEQEQDGLVRFGRELELARILREEVARPVPELILRSLPGLLPPALELTSLRVELDGRKSVGPGAAPVYQVILSGRTAREDQTLLEPIGQLMDALEKSDWRMRILTATGREKPGVEIPAEFRGPGRFYLAAEVQ